MDKIDTLIKTLTELKEEFEKARIDEGKPIKEKQKAREQRMHGRIDGQKGVHNVEGSFSPTYVENKVQQPDIGIAAHKRMVPAVPAAPADNDDNRKRKANPANGNAKILNGRIKDIEPTSHMRVNDWKGNTVKESSKLKKAEYKETLSCSANGQWSLDKSAANPKFAPKEVKIKALQSQIDSGTYKPDSKKIADKMIKPLQKTEEDLDKGAENPHLGHSAFTMDHVNEVSAMKDHKAAKDHAHKIVDESTANPKNKMKLKAMINGSKNVSHLALGMSNHVLAHPSENLKVGR